MGLGKYKWLKVACNHKGLGLRGSGNLIRIPMNIFVAKTKFVVFKGKGIRVSETCTLGLI